MMSLTILSLCISMNLVGTQSMPNEVELLPPPKPLRVLYQRPPQLMTVRILTQIDNINISARNSNTNVATVSEIVNITECPNSMNSVKVYGNQMNTTDRETQLQSECRAFSFYAYSVYLGYTYLTFTSTSNVNGSDVEISLGKILLVSIRPRRIIDTVFKYLLMTMLSLSTFCMGCDLDTKTVKDNLKRPKAVLVAISSQYIFMPLLAYAIVHIKGYRGGWALGYFLIGCMPGGGPSNLHAKLLNGDISLSITLTTLSTLASLGMLPFWLYILGSTLPADEDVVEKISVPFKDIFISLAVLVGPLLAGLLVKIKLPNVARRAARPLKGYFLVLLLLITACGIYSNLYIYHAFMLDVIVASAFLPLGGYLFGAFISFVCRLNWKIIKTVSLETGVQNMGLAVLILQSSLKQPDADLAKIPVVAALLMTSAPLFIITPIYMLRERFVHKKRSLTRPEEVTEDVAAADKLTYAATADDNDVIDESSAAV